LKLHQVSSFSNEQPASQEKAVCYVRGIWWMFK
jgi:hypothetical protein